MQLKINGKKVFFTSLGNGPQILILPGWTHDHNVWQAIQSILSNHYQVIILDFPGFGESEYDPNIKDLNGYAKFLSKVIRELNLKEYIILGHSFGGAAAIKTLALNPEIKPRILILVDSSGIRRLHPKKIVGLFLAKAGKLTFQLPGLKNLYQPARRLLYKTLKETDYIESGKLKQTFIRVVNDNIEGQLDKIKTKTFIIWGKNDTVTPISEANIFQRKIANAKLTIMDNCSHFPFLDKPQEFCKIVTEFVNE